MTYQLRSNDTESARESNAALSNALNVWLTSHGPNAIFRTCMSCTNMVQDGPAFCRLYNVTPPVAVILAGCDKHNDGEEIPF